MKIGLHWVGFEPTRLASYELESYPLDHSGTNAIKKVIAGVGLDPTTSEL